jgi:hypothetical protein
MRVHGDDVPIGLQATLYGTRWMDGYLSRIFSMRMSLNFLDEPPGLRWISSNPPMPFPRKSFGTSLLIGAWSLRPVARTV